MITPICINVTFQLRLLQLIIVHSACLKFRLRLSFGRSEKSVEWPYAIWPFDRLYPNLMNGNSAV